MKEHQADFIIAVLCFLVTQITTSDRVGFASGLMGFIFAFIGTFKAAGEALK